jgi:hypothetical protein
MAIDRRALLLGLVCAAAQSRAAAAQQHALAAAWREAGAEAEAALRVGVLDIDWAAGAIAIRHALRVPSRAHGFWPAPDGGYYAFALRPGRWLMRVDREGRIVQRIAPFDEGGGHSYAGHGVTSADGRWLFTTQTDESSGSGRIGVRDAATLRQVDEWSSQGIEPHHLLLDGAGHLLVANGGIRRGPGDAKLALDRMDSSLVHIDAGSGRVRGQWRLDDPRLSLRHLAWTRPGVAADGSPPLLGIALQAEHDDPAHRRAAPVLALWDGQHLQVPTNSADAGGLAGDIATAGDGGLVVSNHRLHRAWLWQPMQPDALTTIAQLQRAYALASWGDGAAQGVLIAAAAGVGRWHPSLPPRLLPWPAAMALDNHWMSLMP